MIIIIIDDVDRIIVYKSAKIVQVEKSKIQIRSTTMKNYSDELGFHFDLCNQKSFLHQLAN